MQAGKVGIKKYIQVTSFGNMIFDFRTSCIFLKTIGIMLSYYTTYVSSFSILFFNAENNMTPQSHEF